MKKQVINIYFTLVGLLLLFATLNMHSRSGEFNYHSEIFADKAGYQVYLPASFIYHFNATEFPDSVEFKTGEGFKLDRIQNLIFTKYTCGVAVMQMPFFLAAHLYCKVIEPASATGYSRPYHYATDLAAVFYGLWGLFFLYKFIRNYYSERLSLISILVFLLSTNLLYYIVKESGLSHVYSFFLIAFWLTAYKQFIQLKIWPIKNILLIATITGLIIIVRPINLIFLPFLLVIDHQNFNDLKELILKFKTKVIACFTCVIALVLLPQIAYNLYMFHSPFAYSYGNEGFVYLTNPQLQRVLFSFENGLFAMNPIHLFTLAGMFVLIKLKQNGWLSLFLFLTITYVYASWWSPQLGCGLGHRGFVEFYAILILPFTAFLKTLFEFRNRILKISFICIIIVFILINLKITYTYDGCWYGKTIWDVNEINRLLIS